MRSSIPPEVPAILVVDDVPANLLVFEAVLAPLGYRLEKARSGAEALQLATEHEFLVILMDVHMAGMDGYVTTSLLRENPTARHTPIIFITAVYDQPEHTRQGYALGAVDYITKPFDPEVLRAKVRALANLYMFGRRAERERNEERQRTEELFLGAIGHDLRGPLNTILLVAQLMAREGELASFKKLAAKVDRAGRRMHRMIEDLLDLTRRQLTGGIPLVRAPMSLEDLCRTAVEDAALAQPDASVVLDVRGDTAGVWDADRLRRVVANLLGNALHHGDGSPVRVTVEGDADVVRVEVHNGGPAIPADRLETIFEPLERGEEARGYGLGLGLYIVRELVRAHGGSLDVRSSPEDGTAFTVTLGREPAA